MSEQKKRPESPACSLAAGILLIGLISACVQPQIQPPPAPLTPDCPPHNIGTGKDFRVVKACFEPQFHFTCGLKRGASQLIGDFVL